jgi:pyridoxal phosphate enzyme (YggS family)
MNKKYDLLINTIKSHKVNQQNDINLVVVSKSMSLEQIKHFVKLGNQDFAENKAQILAGKASHLADEKIIWHFIGPLQSNKLNIIAKHCNWVQSLEKFDHAVALNHQAQQNNKIINILIQVNISNEPNKHGVYSFEDIVKLANEISCLPNLKLRGLMGIASNSKDKNLIYNEFNYLKKIYKQLQATIPVDTLSMGMSNDFEIALTCGSNMLRVGSLLIEDSINLHLKTGKIKIKVQEANLKDADVFSGLILQLGYPISRDEIISSIKKYLEDQHYKLFVALINDKIVGLASIIINDYFHKASKFAIISALVVDKAYRGKGIGTTLMNFVEEHAKSVGCIAIELKSGAHRTKEGTYKFYENRNYVNIAADHAYFKKQLT